MKKILHCFATGIVCFAFCGNVMADDTPGAVPPTEVQCLFAPAKVEIPLNNRNKPVIVRITDNKGVVVFKTVTAENSIKIDAKYLQENVYRITIISRSRNRR